MVSRNLPPELRRRGSGGRPPTAVVSSDHLRRPPMPACCSSLITGLAKGCVCALCVAHRRRDNMSSESGSSSPEFTRRPMEYVKNTARSLLGMPWLSKPGYNNGFPYLPPLGSPLSESLRSAYPTLFNEQRHAVGFVQGVDAALLQQWRWHAVLRHGALS
eukprot:2267646-Prymnesium_polylepis.2